MAANASATRRRKSVTLHEGRAGVRAESLLRCREWLGTKGSGGAERGRGRGEQSRRARLFGKRDVLSDSSGADAHLRCASEMSNNDEGLRDERTRPAVGCVEGLDARVAGQVRGPLVERRAVGRHEGGPEGLSSVRLDTTHAFRREDALLGEVREGSEHGRHWRQEALGAERLQGGEYVWGVKLVGSKDRK